MCVNVNVNEKEKEYITNREYRKCVKDRKRQIENDQKGGKNYAVLSLVIYTGRYTQLK